MNAKPIIDDRLAGMQAMHGRMETRAGQMLSEYETALALVVKLLTVLAASSLRENDRK